MVDGRQIRNGNGAQLPPPPPTRLSMVLVLFTWINFLDIFLGQLESCSISSYPLMHFVNIHSVNLKWQRTFDRPLYLSRSFRVDFPRNVHFHSHSSSRVEWPTWFTGKLNGRGGVNNKWSVACTSSLLCFYYYRATKQVLSKQSKAHAIVAIISCWWLFLWLYWTRGPFLSVPHITHCMYICYGENAMHCSLTWGGNKMQWKSRVVSIVARNLVFISPHFLFHCICA